VGSDPHRDRIIRQWATGNALWVKHWRAVIAFVGRQPHLTGGKGEWRADLAWIFKGSNFTAQVEQMLAPPSLAAGKTRRESELDAVFAEDAAKRRAS
jgi:hypothetical protein